MRYQYYLIAGAISVLGLTLGLSVSAQTYPSKSIRLVNAFSPGSGTDFVVRTISQKLSDTLGQPVVVDYRPGASGMIAADILAKSAPDGYTIGVVSSSFSSNPALYPKISYDTLKDFSPISVLAQLPFIATVHPSVPVSSIKDLIDYIKARPGRIFYASSGTGGPSHFSAEIFKLMTGVNMAHVPYKGASPAIADLIAGHVQVMFADALIAGPHIKSGKLKALGVTSIKRVDAWPDLPTISEGGIPGYESSAWFGILAPAGTPHEIVRKIHGEIVRILQNQDFRERIIGSGAIPLGNTPEQFTEQIRAEVAKWIKVAKEANIKLE